MPLNLYRRHRLECEGAHPEDFRSGEWEERRRGWKACNCVIHVSGTLGGKFKRRATGRSTWEDARAYAAALETAGSWNGQVAPPVKEPTPVADQIAPRATIADAINIFLENRKACRVR